MLRFQLNLALMAAVALAPACKRPSAPGTSDSKNGPAASTQAGASSKDAMSKEDAPKPAGASPAIHLRVDYEVDEVLIYEVGLGTDGCLSWERESSDGHQDWIHSCQSCEHPELTKEWVRRASALRAEIELEDENVPADKELLAALNSGTRRYWLTFIDEGKHYRPKTAADYARVRALAVDMWSALKERGPRWEEECDRRSADE